MKKEAVVFTRWLAAALLNQGFRQIRTEQHRTKPEAEVYIFENNLDLQIAIRCLTEDRAKRRATKGVK